MGYHVEFCLGVILVIGIEDIEGGDKVSLDFQDLEVRVSTDIWVGGDSDMGVKVGDICSHANDRALTMWGKKEDEIGVGSCIPGVFNFGLLY
jgi:hypothetical protein